MGEMANEPSTDVVLGPLRQIHPRLEPIYQDSGSDKRISNVVDDSSQFSNGTPGPELG